MARALSDARATLAATTGKASRFAVQWVAERDGAGTVEIEARSMSRRGRVLATRRATLFVLRAGDRVLTSETGPLDLQVRRVRALGGLTARLRALRLDRVLGAGATTTIRSRAAAGSAITVGGTVRWTDAAGATHPARRVTVELHEQTLSGSQVVQTVATDDSGRYDATIDVPAGVTDVAHAAGYNLVVRALATGPGYVIEGPNGTHRINSKLVANAKRGTAYTVDLTAGNVADNNTAFSVGEAMLEVHDYMARIGRPVPAIAVEYPSPHGCSCYNSELRRLAVLRSDRFDADVAHHEYGHYVSDLLGIYRSPEGDHNDLENLSETRGKDAGTRLAWAEGWPSYFGTSLQRGLAGLGIPHVGDDRYTDTEDAAIDDSLEVPRPEQTLGEDNEMSVQRFLWDVLDGARDEGDDVSFGDRQIMTALVDAKAVTLSQAYAALVRDLTPRMRAAVGCIAAQQRISPAFTAPAGGSPLTAQRPTFYWRKGGGGPTYRNDSFVVQFWDKAFTTLLHETPKLADAPGFRPTDETWRKLTAGGRKVLNVVVRGSQTGRPATGPYDSCALQLGS